MRPESLLFGAPRYILRPALLAAYVLNMALTNEVEPVSVLRPLVLALAGSLVVTLLLTWDFLP